MVQTFKQVELADLVRFFITGSHVL